MVRYYFYIKYYFYIVIILFIYYNNSIDIILRSDNMAGYHNYSMSNNAIEAYHTGEKPISKWKKSDIISEINQYRKEFDLPMIDTTKFKKVSIKVMRKHFLRCSSWHHTSSHYNKTDFYSIDEDAIDSLTLDTINHLIE